MTHLQSTKLFLLLATALSLWHGQQGVVDAFLVVQRRPGGCDISTRSSLLAAAAPRFSSPQQEQQQPQPQPDKQTAEEGPLTFADSLREFFLSLTRLSLLDYEWRTTAFRSAEADRLMDQSLARMQGKEQAPYLRPMDAAETKIGPLGKLERWTVEWLSGVIAEEGRRAKKIVSQDGKLVRPIEITGDDGEQQQLGPLGYLEKQVSDFLSSIRRSEQERVRTKTLQPSKLPDDMRGPLGNVELALSKFLAEVRAAETLRAEQSRRRGGEMVRPIDVPGPLGEWEMKVADILRAEERRAMELNSNEGRILRPKDARWQGPLGELEQSIFDFFDQLRTEENERLQSIRQLIQEKRPMDNDRSSLLGAAEAFVTSFLDASQRFTIGVVRAPRLIVSVFERVAELLNSESLPASDKEILRDADNKKSSSRE